MTAITLSSPISLYTLKIPVHPIPPANLSLPPFPAGHLFNTLGTRPVLNLSFGKSGFDSRRSLVCSRATRSKPNDVVSSKNSPSHGAVRRRALQTLLWVAEGVYVLWLFVFPNAPVSRRTSGIVQDRTSSDVGTVAVADFFSFLGDPVWAISSDTINSIADLSLNFFFVLPLMNAVGIHLIDAPVLHPVCEALFNLVIGWTLMFAPLLFTDCKRDRYKWSLDVLWGLQMFLTNTFLIPYMAIRLNDVDASSTPTRLSRVGSVMVNGAPIVGLIGGSVCLVSALWGVFGRMDGNFGSLMDRWDFLSGYVGSERLAYAFVWDIVLYTIFQPWLIGDNLQKVDASSVGVVKYLRFVPVVGLVSYLLSLNLEGEQL